MLEKLADCFKPEERKRGQDLFDEEKVVVSQASDTNVSGFIKASSAVKVILTSAHVGHSLITSRCSCPVFRRGHLCRHAWAVLLALEERESDFLAQKQNVEVETVVEKEPNKFEERQKEYKKQQYEKQKVRAQELRQKKKNSDKGIVNQYPVEVQEALDFFRENGFDFSNSLEQDSLIEARRTLARVFHPDKGGTHEEITLLNKHFTTLSNFI